jgi:hypothetical protein
VPGFAGQRYDVDESLFFDQQNEKPPLGGRAASLAPPLGERWLHWTHPWGEGWLREILRLSEPLELPNS